MPHCRLPRCFWLLVGGGVNNAPAAAAATLTSIAITPASATLNKGQTSQFTATGSYSDASTANLTSTVTWTSSAPSIATIDVAGLATAVAVGTTNITASSGAITSAASVLTVARKQMGGAKQSSPLVLVPTVSTVTLAPVLPTTAGPDSITTDGVNLYVADSFTNLIYKIVIATGVQTTLAGTGLAGAADGAGTAATFNAPAGITTDGTNLYVADMMNNKIRQIVIATGVVSSLTGVANTLGLGGAVDGAATAATFNWPVGITTDGTNLYVTDFTNNKIRKVVIATGVVSSLTGVANTVGLASAVDGAATVATFSGSTGITTDGINLYVADAGNHKIRQIVIATGVVSSLTGVANTLGLGGSVDGAATAATFNFPSGITTDGTNLYVVDTANNKIRQVVIATGVVSSVTGAASTLVVGGAVDGAGAVASFNFSLSYNSVGGITSDGTSLYVADPGNAKIRKIQ